MYFRPRERISRSPRKKSCYLYLSQSADKDNWGKDNESLVIAVHFVHSPKKTSKAKMIHASFGVIKYLYARRSECAHMSTFPSLSTLTQEHVSQCCEVSVTASAHPFLLAYYRRLSQSQPPSCPATTGGRGLVRQVSLLAGTHHLSPLLACLVS